MKRTCVLLIPTMSGITFDETISLVESLLGQLNIETNQECLAFSTTLNLSNYQKKAFSDSLEEKGLKTLFIEGDEELLDKISNENTLDLNMCEIKHKKNEK